MLNLGFQRVAALVFSLGTAITASGCDLQDIQSACEAVGTHQPGAVAPITKQEVLAAQAIWGEGIVAIGAAYADGEDYRAVAKEHVEQLYGYNQGKVLFKPTKAVEQQFRLTKESALSYFVSGSVPEDKGFALQPWSKVRFENADIILGGDQAIAMGNYYFTDANTGEDTKVEYTFGYVRNAVGELVINVHHSALPFPKP